MKEHTYFDEDQPRDCGCPHSPKSYEPNAKVINLAIQGGGAHGAYSWGVIDRLKELCDLSVASKFNTDRHFLLYLRDLGRQAARNWLAENFNSIGERSTVDLRAEFLDIGVEHAG